MGNDSNLTKGLTGLFSPGQFPQLTCASSTSVSVSAMKLELPSGDAVKVLVDGQPVAEGAEVAAGSTLTVEITVPDGKELDVFEFEGLEEKVARKEYVVKGDVTLKVSFKDKGGAKPIKPTAVEAMPASVQCFPNPVADGLQVKAEEVVLRYRVLDLQGRSCLSGAPRGESFVIDMTGLAPGVYVLVLEGKDGPFGSTRISKQ